MAPFTPRQRKHKNRAKVKLCDESQAGANSNVLQIVPEVVKEKEAKKGELKESLRRQQPRMSSKKQKRLDKYIVSDGSKEDAMAC